MFVTFIYGICALPEIRKHYFNEYLKYLCFEASLIVDCSLLFLLIIQLIIIPMLTSSELCYIV